MRNTNNHKTLRRVLQKHKEKKKHNKVRHAQTGHGRGGPLPYRVVERVHVKAEAFEHAGGGARLPDGGEGAACGEQLRHGLAHGQQVGRCDAGVQELKVRERAWGFLGNAFMHMGQWGVMPACGS